MTTLALRGPRRLTGLAAIALVAGVPAAFAQGTAEVYNATALLKTAGGTSVTAPVVISISRWTTDAERDKVRATLKAGGTTAVQKELAAAPEAGVLQVGQVKAPLRFARALPVAGGKVITVATSQPVFYVGAGMTDAKKSDKAGYDLAVVIFQVDAAGKGDVGDFAPAAKVKFDETGAFVVEDYGAEAVRLNGIAKK
jgi:hypothetical protein